MGRKGKRGGRRGRRGGRGGGGLWQSGTTSVDFSSQVELNFNVTGGKVELDLFPHAVGFCDRFSDVAYNFAYYRITSLEYFFVPSTTRVSNECFAHAVLPTDDGALVLASFGELCQIPQAKIYDAREVTLRKNRISRRALMAQPVKWWSTTDSGNTKSDFVQCSLMAVSSQGQVSNSIMVLFKFRVQFTAAANDGKSLFRRLPSNPHQDTITLKETKSTDDKIDPVEEDRLVSVKTELDRLQTVINELLSKNSIKEH